MFRFQVFLCARTESKVNLVGKSILELSHYFSLSLDRLLIPSSPFSELFPQIARHDTDLVPEAR